MPVVRLLYPDLVGEELDSHRAFVVKYSLDEDVELSYHYDNAEVTINVCLTSDFTGGQLYFGPMRQVGIDSIQSLGHFQLKLALSKTQTG